MDSSTLVLTLKPDIFLSTPSSDMICITDITNNSRAKEYEYAHNNKGDEKWIYSQKS